MKKLIAMMLCAAAVISCTACGNSADTSASGSSTSEASSDAAAEETAVTEIEGVTVDGRLADILERGYIEVATEPYFAPYEFIDPSKSGDEQYQGMDIEIAKVIAEKLGVELKIVPLEFSAVLASVTEGKYDLAMSAMAYSQEREAAMRLSDVYFDDSDESHGYGLACRPEDVDKYTSIESLKDAVVTTQSGSVQEEIFKTWVTEDGCKELKLFSAMTDSYLAVAEGKADVVVCEKSSARLYGDANSNIAVVESFKFDADEYMGVRIGAPLEDTESLMEVVNKITAELMESGQTNEWYEEYTEYAKNLGI